MHLGGTRSQALRAISLALAFALGLTLALLAVTPVPLASAAPPSVPCDAGVPESFTTYSGYAAKDDQCLAGLELKTRGWLQSGTAARIGDN